MGVLIHRPRGAFLAAALICLFVGLCTAFTLALGSSIPSGDSLSLLLISALIVLGWIPLQEMRRGGQMDVFHPLFWLWLSSIGPFIILKGIALVFWDVPSDSLGFANIPESRNLALLCALLGATAMFLGYYSGIGNRLVVKLPALSVPIQKPVWLATCALILAWVGDGATLYLSRLGLYGYVAAIGYTGFTQYLTRLSEWRFMALFLILWLWAAMKPRRSRVTLILLAALVPHLMIDVLGGGRGRLYTTVLFLFAAYSYVNLGKMKFRSIAVTLSLVLISLVAGILFFTEFRFVRNEYSALTNNLSINETVSLLEYTADRLSTSDLGSSMKSVVMDTLVRLNTIDVMSLVIARADELKPFERAVGMDNNIMKELTVTWIPRALWPNKPDVGNLGLWMTQVYYGKSFYSWSSPTILGDLYRNFGWVGVPIGMFILGIYLNSLYAWLILRTAPSWEHSLFYYLLLGTVSFQTNYTSFVGNGSRVAIFCWLFVFFAHKLGSSSKEVSVFHN